MAYDVVIANHKMKWLDESIDGFVSMNKVEPYLIMSKNTSDLISDVSGAVNVVQIDDPGAINPNGIIAKYKSCKIFIDNDIPFGVVKFG